MAAKGAKKRLVADDTEFAKELFGAAESRAVKEGWKAVGITA